MPRDDFDREMGEAIDDTLASLDDVVTKMQQEVRSVMTDSKILCLAELSDDAAMWAYYAEQHQGLVLKFGCAPGVDSPWTQARRVEYVSAMPRFGDDEFFTDFLAGRVSLDPRSMLDRLVYTKASVWTHEREWRIYAGSERFQASYTRTYLSIRSNSMGPY
jgi:hypothetical protein